MDENKKRPMWLLALGGTSLLVMLMLALNLYVYKSRSANDSDILLGQAYTPIAESGAYSVASGVTKEELLSMLRAIAKTDPKALAVVGYVDNAGNVQALKASDLSYLSFNGPAAAIAVETCDIQILRVDASGRICGGPGRK